MVRSVLVLISSRHRQAADSGNIFFSRRFFVRSKPKGVLAAEESSSSPLETQAALLLILYLPAKITTIANALTKVLFPGGDLPTCKSVLDAIGNSPMVALERFGNGIAPSLFAKLEASNPGGSMKDRAALGMLEWAEREYDLRPGAEIVICTSGNMGVGMAVVCEIGRASCRERVFITV